MDKRVFIETFGCQMNILDSELVQSQLVAEGYDFVAKPEDANIVLFNTCSVRDLAEHKVLSRLGITKQRKDAGENIVVGVLGCMAERTGTDLVKKYPHIDLMVGPSKLNEVAGMLATVRGGHSKIALSGFKERKGKGTELASMDSLEALDQGRLAGLSANKSQAYVRITRGCNKFCSFCVVPRTRGPEMHRHPDSIVDEIKRLADQGVLEVTLLGQTINHYFYDEGGKKTSFADLLFRIHEEVTHLPRLRFLTSYPRDFTDEALDVMASSARICKYLHIPAQSGSDDVLRRMNRGYTREIYMNLIERAKSRMPDLAIIGDMIVGFPGETDADFEASLSLIREVRYKNIFVFKYSTRPGTVAHKNFEDDIPTEVKRERNNRMLEVHREINMEHHQAMMGKTYRVIVEGHAKLTPNPELINLSSKKQLIRLSARTEGDHIVALDGPESLIGQIINVQITRATSLSLSGILSEASVSSIS